MGRIAVSEKRYPQHSVVLLPSSLAPMRSCIRLCGTRGPSHSINTGTGKSFSHPHNEVYVYSINMQTSIDQVQNEIIDVSADLLLHFGLIQDEPVDIQPTFAAYVQHLPGVSQQGITNEYWSETSLLPLVETAETPGHIQIRSFESSQFSSALHLEAGESLQMVSRCNGSAWMIS